MAFGLNVGRALTRGHNVKRKLFLGKDVKLVLVKGNHGEMKLAELSDGWHFDFREKYDPELGKRYYPLAIDDVEGERLGVLQQMVAVRLNGVFYKPIAKPTFEGTIPSYRFKMQEVGPQI
jgi:hypothetical protein